MSESKEEEKNPDVEEQWGDANLSLVLKEASAIWSKNISFRQTLTDWAESHSEEFEEYVGLPDLASCEHKLHFRDLHSEYLTIFEDQITEFIVEEGYTIQDFFKECKEVMDDFGCALFEEHEDKWFVEAVIQAVDYQGWFAMMVETAGAAGGRK
ncbi:hypothetical protein TrVE_jg1424 [Triparma verrucosa]|uniref:BART domain-containing protein n=1 Tax=Triparma verrucosa TaxID=1606542 RepID=A0A9W7C7Z0_9STRA|nr:hypothetical protein TrVE_jg1424 [Triparma verrucosa]|mmetsp:Transcript_1501/g.2629  ORF Transcript_1501/g.2629 Transcript_1501/m.2629 type:complete len:154 (+) Transcript_1501:180-641(+)